MRAKRRVAAIVTHYTHNSHADVLVSRMLQGDHLDRRPPFPNLELASLYTDQVPAADMSRALAREHGFRLSPTIADALTLGGDTLAVDGVLLIGEHGSYPNTPLGQIAYPRRRFLDATLEVFRRSGRVVPVFTDKHFAATWDDAAAMWEAARALKVPLMAGSSVPGTWRRPARELPAGTRLASALGLSFGPLEGYGYHGLEALQSIVERRRGGEAGVTAVQYVEGDAVWTDRRLDRGLFEIAAATRATEPKGEAFRKALKPAGIFVEYRDGLKLTVLHDLGYANHEWVSAWRAKGRRDGEATVHYTQEARPFYHFALLLRGIERMVETGVPTWPAERTLLVTGIVAALFASKQQGGARVETPHLAIRYRSGPAWTEPPAPPPDRPIDGQ